MKGSIAITAASAALAAAVATPVEKRADGTKGSLPTVTTKGNAFYAGDKRFYIRGVDYLPGGSSDPVDPLADTSICKRDVPEFKKLGVNTVRVYTIDNTADHDDCMKMYDDAGIYIALDVNTPKYSLRRDQPAQSYNADYLESVFATMSMFAPYTNTLLFFSGNEVINDAVTTQSAPYIKAVTRDMKSYIAGQKLRQVPVGYSAADVEENRYFMATYMNCGPDDERSDFYAFNDYSWCDPASSFTISGWDQKVQQYGNYSLPIFLSEFGCNKGKRTWEEVGTLYSDKMSSVYSGGIAFEYSEEGDNFGLVKISGNSVSEEDDFTALMNEFKQTSDPSGDGGAKSSGSASKCPTAGQKDWDLGGWGDDNLPALPSDAAKFMKDGVSKGPGLKGSGSQESGPSSHPTASSGSGSGSGSSGTSGGSGSDSSTSSGAANAVVLGEMSLAPLAIAAIVSFFTLVGTQLL